MSKSSTRIRMFLPWLVAVFVVTSSACVCGLRGRQSPSTNLPAWSPDGEQIAYIVCEKECTIYRINANGSGLIQLTTDKVAFWPPAWSPDGQQIAFVRPTPGFGTTASYFNVNLIHADGTDPVTIGPGERPVWSPDGSRLAYSNMCGDCMDYGLNVVGAAGDNLLSLSSQGARMVAWSPDGSQVYFQSWSFSNNRYETFAVHADGSNEIFITDALVSEVPASLSPDGEWFLFANGKDIYVLNVDGSGLTHLTGDLTEGERPLWSPDGAQIVFVSDRDGNNEVYVMDADGGDRVRLTDDPASDEDPAWSPDGLQIVFVSYRDSRQGDLFIMNADGSDLVKLAGE